MAGVVGLEPTSSGLEPDSFAISLYSQNGGPIQTQTGIFGFVDRCSVLYTIEP